MLRMRMNGDLLNLSLTRLASALLAALALGACTETPEFPDREFVSIVNQLQGIYTVTQADLDDVEGQWGRAVVLSSNKAGLQNLLRENEDNEGNITWEATSQGLEFRTEDARGQFKDRRNGNAKGFYDSTYGVLSWLDTHAFRWKLFARQLTDADNTVVLGEYYCMAWNNDGAGSEGIDFYSTQYFGDGSRVDSPVSASPLGRTPVASAYEFSMETDGRLTLTNTDLDAEKANQEAALATEEACQPEEGQTGLNPDCQAFAGLFGAVALDGNLTFASRIVDSRIKEELAEDEEFKPKDEWGEGGHFEMCARKGANHEQATLAGDYWVHFVEKVNGAWQGALGEMTLDESGLGTLKTVYVTNGTPTRQLAVSVTVDGDGKLTVNGKPGAVIPSQGALFFDASDDQASPATIGMVWATRKLPPPEE